MLGSPPVSCPGGPPLLHYSALHSHLASSMYLATSGTGCSRSAWRVSGASDSMGLVLQTAVPTLGDARDDWKILRAVSEVLGVTLPVER